MMAGWHGTNASVYGYGYTIWWHDIVDTDMTTDARLSLCKDWAVTYIISPFLQNVWNLGAIVLECTQCWQHQCFYACLQCHRISSYICQIFVCGRICRTAHVPHYKIQVGYSGGMDHTSPNWRWPLPCPQVFFPPWHHHESWSLGTSSELFVFKTDLTVGISHKKMWAPKSRNIFLIWLM